MNFFDAVDEKFKDLPYMNRSRAAYIRDFIGKNDCNDILEIGFYKGKSSAYFAAILEDRGSGHLTTIDRKQALTFEPNINQVLLQAGLSHRVTPIFSQRSHTWEMGKMLRSPDRPQFDLCYFDGGHTWDVTGFGFLLVDTLLRPGGWIIFDDLDWTISKSISNSGSSTKRYGEFSEDEKDTPAVRLVFEHLTKHLGYTDFKEVAKYSWGIARKPLMR